MNFLYAGEDIPLVFTSEVSKFYLKLDSHNKVYRVKFSCEHKDTHEYFNVLCAKFQDAHIDSLVQIMIDNKKHYPQNYLYDFSAMQIMLALNTMLAREVKDLDANEIICRCNGIDRQALKSQVIKYKGLKTELQKNTHIAMICSGCLSEFETQLNQINEELGYFGGYTKEEVFEFINKKLDEFIMFSPAEFEGAHFECRHLMYPEITIHILSASSALNLQNAQVTLQNYLAKELELPIEIKIIFDN